MELPWDRIEHVLGRTPPIRVSGRVVRVGGLLVEGTMPGAKMGMMCRLMLRGDDKGVPAEIVALHDRRVSLMPLSAVPGITVGTRIEPGDHDPSVPVSDEMIGRVLDGWSAAWSSARCPWASAPSTGCSPAATASGWSSWRAQASARARCSA
jgi:flagellar biosynthesis/type III secretory pathway ATPase